MSDFLKIGDDGPKLDTAAMASAGKALLNGTTPASTPTTPSSTPAAVPVQSTVTVTPVEQPVTAANPAALQSQQPATPQAQQPATEAAAETPTYVTGDDNALVELTINGQKQVMKFGEAKKQMMLHSTFTQNQQRLAAERKAWEAEKAQLAARAEQATKLERLVSSPELFAQYAVANPIHAAHIARMFGTTVSQATAGAPTGPAATAAQAPATPFGGPVSNPDEIVNMGELATALNQRSAELEARFGQAFNQTLEQRATAILRGVDEAITKRINDLKDSHEVATFDRQIVKTINDNLEANPALKAIPKIDQLIRYEVGLMQPQTPQEMFDAISTVSKGIVEQLDQTYNTAFQAKQIVKEKLATEGIEGPGGQAPNTTIKPNVSLAYGGPKDKDFFKRLAAAGKAVLNATP